MFAVLVVHIGRSPTADSGLRTRLTSWVGSSVLFTHYRPTFPCRGFGELIAFFFRLHFAELGPRYGNSVQKACLHDLHRFLGVLRDQ